MYAETTITFTQKEKYKYHNGKEIPAINAFIERLEANEYAKAIGITHPVKEHETEIEYKLIFNKHTHTARLIIQAPTIDDILTNMPMLQKTKNNDIQNNYAEQMKQNLTIRSNARAQLLIESINFQNLELATNQFFEEKLSKYFPPEHQTNKIQNIIQRHGGSIELCVPNPDFSNTPITISNTLKYTQIGKLVITKNMLFANRYLLSLDTDLTTALAIRNSFLAEEQEPGKFDALPKTKFPTFTLRTHRNPEDKAKEELAKQKKEFEQM